MTQLIIYACPVGPLAEQIKLYLEESKRMCGMNAAHVYMPHCTLTGFFEDERGSIAHYTETLNKVFRDAINTTNNREIYIKKLTFNNDWHGLELEAEWLKRAIAQFAKTESSKTRQQPLRLKDWLHLSLAYNFQPEDSTTLQALATEMIDLSAAVSWELRLYERLARAEATPEQQYDWTCHAQWEIPLTTP